MEAESKEKARIRYVFEWLEAALFALLMAVFLFAFVIKSYTVDGESMLPTLKNGDFVIALSLLFEPEAGDVVVVDDTTSYGKPLIKRVIAVGGDSVLISSAGILMVNGKISAYQGTLPENCRGDLTYPLIVPEGYVFLMGDNRSVSKDSRYSDVGLIDVRSIVGKEIFNF